jgi:signal peptide peptidase SppA
MKSYPHIERYVREQPWAIQRGTLEAMLEALSLSKAGVELTREELEERTRGGAGQGSSSRAGAVAVIPIYGVIMPRASLFSEVSGGTSLETFRSELDEAVRDKDVGAILLDVNSPGGSTELLTETAGELRAARESKPVVAVANTLAASAAYHLGSQADELFVTPSGYAGSIGVYSAHDDLSGSQEKAGVKTTLVHAGRYKVEGNPFEPLGEEARAEMQRRVDAAYELMVADIAAGRRVAEGTVRDGYGEGRVLDAKAAQRAGMVDGVQTFDATLGALLSSGSSGRAGATIGRAVDVTLIGETAALAASIGLPRLPSSSSSSSETFQDAVERAVSALEAVVADSERFPRLSRTKRERLEELSERLRARLATTEPAAEEPAGENLEAETEAAIAAARLAIA